MRSTVATIIAAVAVGIAQTAIAQELPKGWRFPTKSEIADDVSRKDSPTGFTRATADLNGDGVEDELNVIGVGRAREMRVDLLCVLAFVEVLELVLNVGRRFVVRTVACNDNRRHTPTFNARLQIG